MHSIRSIKSHKVIFVGEQGVGKTSIIRQFLYNTFDAQYQATIGIDFVSKILQVNNGAVKLQLWDTAGQERFRSLIPSYLRDTAASVVVFDLTNRRSFDNITHWVEEVWKERGEEVVIVLVGNKSDLAENRVVTPEEANKLAAELKIALYIEASAKTGAKIEELFARLARLLPTESLGKPKNVGGDQQEVQLSSCDQQKEEEKKLKCC